MQKIPAVSVIIPLYNAEKYIGECLDSVLAQTFQNFEVIIVDDCSTDNSVEVVEGLTSRFDSIGVKLHIIKLPKNSGRPGLPRNIGIRFACGKYISFLDSDDFYTETALEELSTLAEDYQADVVHSDTFLLFEENNVTVCQRQKLPVVPEPIFETKDISKRIRQWITRGYNWETITTFCRRDFIITKQIQFPKLRAYEDMLFNFSVLCFAEKFLRVPNLTYVYVKRMDSLSYENFNDVSVRFPKYIRVLNDGFAILGQIMASIPFFEKNPEYRYAVLNFFFNDVLGAIRPMYPKNDLLTFFDLMKKECQSYDTDLAAYMFNTVNVQYWELVRLQAENDALKKSLAQK